MDYLGLHDYLLYLIGVGLFFVSLSLIYCLYRCLDRTPRLRNTTSTRTVYTGTLTGSASAQNLLCYLADWKGEPPTYVSQWSFQDECFQETEWRKSLEAKAKCLECERLLAEEGEASASDATSIAIYDPKTNVEYGKVTVV